MIPIPLALHAGLASTARLPNVAGARRTISLAEVAVLLTCGIAAAAMSSFGQMPLRIPGHAIIRCALPMGLGLALVPRHGAGFCMSATAWATAWLFGLAGLGRTGPGAVTGMIAIGPCLDLAVLGARSGWRLYVSFVAGGILGNLIALVIRGGLKALLPAPMEGQPIAEWIGQAALTYPICGAIAGLLGAIVWFRFRGGAERTAPDPGEVSE